MRAETYLFKDPFFSRIAALFRGLYSQTDGASYCACTPVGGCRERERQTDRQTDRQTETEREKERETERERERERPRHTQRDR